MTSLAARPATCAICGWRPSTTTTDWDDRSVNACSTCLAEVHCDDEPPFHLDDLPMASRVVYYARNHPGLTAQQLGDALGLAMVDQHRGGDRNTLSVSLGRAVRAGSLRRVAVIDNDETDDDCAGSPWRYYPTVTEWSPPAEHGGNRRTWREIGAICRAVDHGEFPR